ncbi:hypothetical protein [Pedobacter jeongneungensis]|uniref:hypothetical protein n=1 Tax=Pedobacter jeongneungensis TaxID=947309 RepID=UPI0013B3BD0F|nr:hypothetical protein [Pedobacter jeongneungensis]
MSKFTSEQVDYFFLRDRQNWNVSLSNDKINTIMTQDDSQDFVPETVLFGTTLAIAVATKLKSGLSFGYSHRDYCGMGILFQDGMYYYGEIWDGYLEPMLSFEGEVAFIAWLAMQSTSSLARLDDEEFFRGNQIVSRLRLEGFLEGTSSIRDYLLLYHKL